MLYEIKVDNVSCSAHGMIGMNLVDGVGSQGMGRTTQVVERDRHLFLGGLDRCKANLQGRAYVEGGSGRGPPLLYSIFCISLSLCSPFILPLLSSDTPGLHFPRQSSVVLLSLPLSDLNLIPQPFLPPSCSADYQNVPLRGGYT